jgi:ribonuclease J
MTKHAKAHARGGETLRILPLGGLGEIGMNLTLYGVGDDWLAVDAGVQFCEPGTVGAELMLPDLDLLSEYRDRVQALVVTHGHEDHIGAIPHFVAACPVPVYCAPFVAEVIGAKIEEFGGGRRPDLRPMDATDRVQVGPMRVEFVPVTHSIPDSRMVVIRTPVGTVVHTGDFKLDPEPLDGRRVDAARLKRLGHEGVRLLMSDSTNAGVAGHTRNEIDVARELDKLVLAARGRVVVSLFASNVERVCALARAADRHRRRVALVGRSLNLYLDAARRAGIARDLPDFVDAHQVERMSDRDLVVICTGSQSEPRSALYRASVQDHPDLRIHPTDLVVLSSRIIPGNERAIFRMVNNLVRQGAHVLHERNAPVHASGHAQRDELKDLLEWIRPATFVPIHGEYAFLNAHAELAAEAGVPDVRVLENGQVLELTADDATVAEKVPLRFHYVDGPLVGDAEELRLDERRRIGWTGVIAARLVAERGRKRWKARLDLRSVACPLNGGTLMDEAAEYALHQIVDLPVAATRKQVEETLVGSLRAFFRRRLDRKPSVLAFVEVDGEG